MDGPIERIFAVHVPFEVHAMKDRGIWRRPINHEMLKWLPLSVRGPVILHAPDHTAGKSAASQHKEDKQ